MQTKPRTSARRGQYSHINASNYRDHEQPLCILLRQWAQCTRRRAAALPIAHKCLRHRLLHHGGRRWAPSQISGREQVAWRRRPPLRCPQALRKLSRVPARLHIPAVARWRRLAEHMARSERDTDPQEGQPYVQGELQADISHICCMQSHGESSAR